MKKLFLMALVAALLLPSCGKKQARESVKSETVTTEGWVDDNTFQVRAWGEASPEVTGEARWRNQAQTGAKMMAQTRVMEIFKGHALQASGYTEEGGEVEMKVSSEIEGFARGGEIIRTTFDKEHRMAEIIYRVRANNLRQKVETGFEIIE